MGEEGSGWGRKRVDGGGSEWIGEGWNAPEDVGSHDLHEVVDLDISEDFVRADDPGVSEHDVETAVLSDCFVDDGAYGGLVAGVELACVDVDGGVEGGELGLVGGEVHGGEVAHVDCARSIVGILVGGGAADADGGVGACSGVGVC